MNKTLDRNLTIARSILDVTGKEIFFDASKNARIAAKLAERADIDFKLVHLVRDPRGVLNSTQKRNQNATAEFVGKHWLRIQMSALSIKESLPDSAYLLVNYESLCANPRETLRHICQFLDVDDFDLLSRAMQQEHHLIGNQMRGQQLENIHLDEAWRTHLQPAQLSEIKRITGALGLTLGYEME